MLIAAILVLPLTGECRPQKEKAVNKGKIAAIVNEYRGYDGVETVRLGRLGTAALKGVIKISADDDPETRELINNLKGVKSFTVFDFEDAAPSVKEKINTKLSRALEEVELLMELKDGEDKMKMYGVCSDDGQKITDFILHSPSDCALICIYGTVSPEIISSLNK